MTMELKFKPVEPNDFLTFTPGAPSHIQIETAIIDIGGGGKKGIEYKWQVLAAAGWKYKELTSYGAHAEIAAEAFNRIREVLAQTDESEEVLAMLKAEN
ncbi:hypothetical protein [Aliikangiella sp. IMCC44632]